MTVNFQEIAWRILKYFTSKSHKLHQILYGYFWQIENRSSIWRSISEDKNTTTLIFLTENAFQQRKQYYWTQPLLHFFCLVAWTWLQSMNCLHLIFSGATATKAWSYVVPFTGFRSFCLVWFILRSSSHYSLEANLFLRPVVELYRLAQ